MTEDTGTSATEQTESSGEQVELEPPQPNRTAPRPRRHALVPLRVYLIVGALLVVVAAGIGAALALEQSSAGAVPDVIGLDADVARTRIRTAGFEFLTGNRRFSVAEVDIVLEQSPEAGTTARKGSAVTVVVSAGTEEFALPDITGNGITLGRGMFEERGLEVKVSLQSSDLPRDTVISTNPSAGSTVHTGDIVIVSVAASGTIDDVMVPYRFSGVLVVIDPSKPATGTDLPLEVSRRLRSLLEASGAAVSVSRSATTTDSSSVARARSASEASRTASVLVGLDVASTAPGGFSLATPSGLATDRQQQTQRLLSALTAGLTVQQKAPRHTTYAPDVVVKSVQAPVVRVGLGSLADRDDVASFKDPAWADQVARTIYRGLGETFAQ